MRDFNLDFHYAMQMCFSSNIKRITGLKSNIKISFNFKINSFTFVCIAMEVERFGNFIVFYTCFRAPSNPKLHSMLRSTTKGNLQRK